MSKLLSPNQINDQTNKTDHVHKMNTLLSNQTKPQNLKLCKHLDEKTERQVTTALKFVK